MAFKINISKKEDLRIFQSIALEVIDPHNVRINNNEIIFKYEDDFKKFNKTIEYNRKNTVVFEVVDKGLNHTSFVLTWSLNGQMKNDYLSLYKGTEVRISNNWPQINWVEEDTNLLKLFGNPEDYGQDMYYLSAYVHSNKEVIDLLNKIREEDFEFSIRRLSYEECIFSSFGRMRGRYNILNIEDINILNIENHKCVILEELEDIEDVELEELEEIEV